MKKLIILFLSLTLVFALCACAQRGTEAPVEEDPVEESGDKDSEEDVVPTEPEETIDIINPLTGEALEEDISANRPYAFMLNNLKKALPQCGISKADIIYEIVAEGGITRMLAIFQDLTDVGAIGSIRSARPYYIDVALAYDPIYIHAGGSDQAYSDIKSKGVLNFDGVNGSRGTKIFYRDSWRRQNIGYEHSMFTTSELIEQYIYPMDIRHEHEDGYKFMQTYTSEPIPDGKAAEKITANFASSNQTRFEYDAETQKYLVFDYGIKYVDGNTDEQVGVKNVLFLFTDISRISGDSAGRMKVRTTGTGTGLYACEGRIVPINWSRDDSYSQFVYTTEDGSALSLGRGNTYVCVLSSASDVTY